MGSKKASGTCVEAFGCARSGLGDGFDAYSVTDRPLNLSAGGVWMPLGVIPSAIVLIVNKNFVRWAAAGNVDLESTVE